MTDRQTDRRQRSHYLIIKRSAVLPRQVMCPSICLSVTLMYDIGSFHSYCKLEVFALCERQHHESTPKATPGKSGFRRPACGCNQCCSFSSECACDRLVGDLDVPDDVEAASPAELRRRQEMRVVCDHCCLILCGAWMSLIHLFLFHSNCFVVSVSLL